MEHPAERIRRRRSPDADLRSEVLEDVVGEYLELRLLAEEIGLVVGEVADHALELLCLLGTEPEIVVVVLEGHEVQAPEAPREARPQGPLLGIVEVETESLMDEVPEESELLFGEVDIVVGRTEQSSSAERAS